MKKIFRKESEEEHNFWMSYTDLLSGFLIVFIIATIVYQHEHNKVLQEYNKVINVLREHDYDNVEDVIVMVDDYIQQANLKNINDEFKEVFEKLKIDSVKFDSEEKSIRFYPTYETARDSILFKKDSADMMPNLKKRIRKLGRPMVQKAIHLSDSLYKGKDVNLEIRVEGHTDTRGTFIHNLNLSSRRAESVYKYILDSCGLSKDEQKFVEKQMICVGYSYAKPLDHEGKKTSFESLDVDWGMSRRIELRIISK